MNNEDNENNLGNKLTVNIFDLVSYGRRQGYINNAVILQTVPNLQASNTFYNESGALKLGFPGTIDPSGIFEIVENWDIDRIVLGLLYSFGENMSTREFLYKSLAAAALQPPVTINIAYT